MSPYYWIRAEQDKEDLFQEADVILAKYAL